MMFFFIAVTLAILVIAAIAPSYPQTWYRH
jgi:hypothetical protein